MRVITPDDRTIDLGPVETGVTIGIVDYSRRETDDFGVTTVIERGFARRVSVRVAVPFDSVDSLQRELAGLRAVAATWIIDDRFESLTVTGFYKGFSLDLACPPTSYCTLTIEGLTETVAFDDEGQDPAPDMRPSTLRLLQPVDIDDDALLATSIPENDYPVWDDEAIYSLGARVIKIQTHRISGPRYETDADREDERMLYRARAKTPAGIAAQLRYALYSNSGELFLMAGALGCEVPEMEDMVKMDGAVAETLWTAIQSLEAMEASDAGA